MPRPDPAARVLLALHVACAVPLVALAVWFGLIDRLPFGEGRCSSCGVEGYVIAAHVVAAMWLGGVVACAATARRQAGGAAAAVGRSTTAALAAAGLFVAASLVWHSLFTIPALAAMVASVVLFPVAVIWWVLGAVALWRRPPRGADTLRRRHTSVLTAAWVSLAVLLPATFAWVWSDRVEWLVF